jgi:hypothetical protein
MLTPAEEMGLSGLGVAARVRQALYKLPEAELIGLIRQVEQEAVRRHLVYVRDGKEDTIRILPSPVTILPDQRSYVHFVSLTIENALKRLPELYMQDFAIRDILRLSPEEEEWLWSCWGPSHREHNPLFGRLDAVAEFTSPMWKDSLQFLEPNLSGIGGLHLIPSCERLVADLVVPALRRQDPTLALELGSDIRELLMQEVLDHLDALGRPARNVCFVEPKYAGSGPDEQEELARWCHERFGLTMSHADPAELTLAGDEVCYEGQAIDLAYRDYAVADLVTLAQEGVDVAPMRTLFRSNRMISSIAAELDQKSCWEVLTDPQFTQKYFNAEERQVFRRHVLWTRLLSDRQTLLADGQFGSLLDFARCERESLVLKPNRAFGGEGVHIGPQFTDAEWESALERALRSRERWVVQRLAGLPVAEFPVVDAEGLVHFEPFHVVLGFAPSRYGLAILGRASQKQVVNVCQRGGLCAVLTGHPAARPPWAGA